MKIAVEFDKLFDNEQIIYKVLTETTFANPTFVLPLTKRCPNTKSFECMAAQFGYTVEYHKHPESNSEATVFLTNSNYEIISD